MKPLYLALSMICLGAQLEASALELGAQTRAYRYSCSAYSYLQAEGGIFYRDQAMARGSRVTLIAGWSGYRVIQRGSSRTEQPILWADRIVIPMKLLQDGIWAAYPNHPLHSKGSNEFYSALDFVFEITNPDGTVYYDNGSGTRLGFYRVIFDLNSSFPCVDFGIAPPAYAPQSIRVIRKD